MGHVVVSQLGRNLTTGWHLTCSNGEGECIGRTSVHRWMRFDRIVLFPSLLTSYHCVHWAMREKGSWERRQPSHEVICFFSSTLTASCSRGWAKLSAFVEADFTPSSSTESRATSESTGSGVCRPRESSPVQANFSTSHRSLFYIIHQATLFYITKGLLFRITKF